MPDVLDMVLIDEEVVILWQRLAVRVAILYPTPLEDIGVEEANAMPDGTLRLFCPLGPGTLEMFVPASKWAWKAEA